jgi:hypothetical protein
MQDLTADLGAAADQATTAGPAGGHQALSLTCV